MTYSFATLSIEEKLRNGKIMKGEKRRKERDAKQAANFIEGLQKVTSFNCLVVDYCQKYIIFHSPHQGHQRLNVFIEAVYCLSLTSQVTCVHSCTNRDPVSLNKRFCESINSYCVMK